MKDEALRLALEALKCIESPLYVREINKIGEAITAIKQALEQPEPETVAWMWKNGTVTTDPDRADGTWTPLYTSPPKREWQGLTDEEINEVLGGDIRDEPSGELKFVRAIEAKLKEKNT